MVWRRIMHLAYEWRWEVGRLAAVWIERYARGRTEADLAALTGMSSDQVLQCVMVHRLFTEVRDRYPGLRWNHFYAASPWPMYDKVDGKYDECGALAMLEWANETISTVAEMRACRRAIRGEDLTVDE